MPESSMTTQQPATTANASERTAHRKLRRCTACGAELDVTYLLEDRKYRCATCSASFRHSRAIGSAEAPPFRKPMRSLREVLAALFAGAAVILVARAGDFSIEVERLLYLAGGTAFLAWCASFALRQLARDSLSISAPTMVAAGLGGASVWAIAPMLPDADFRTGPMIALALLGIGGMMLGRLLKLRTLPAVNEHGRCAEVDDPGADDQAREVTRSNT